MQAFLLWFNGRRLATAYCIPHYEDSQDEHVCNSQDHYVRMPMHTYHEKVSKSMLLGPLFEVENGECRNVKIGAEHDWLDPRRGPFEQGVVAMADPNPRKGPFKRSSSSVRSV